MPDRLRLFLGKRPILVNGVGIYSPTIERIDEIGEIQYSIFLMIATFNMEAVLKNIFGVSDQDYTDIENEDPYKILTAIPIMRVELEKSLSFFTKELVVYEPSDNTFTVRDNTFIDMNNYLSVANVIKRQNGITDDEEKKIKFKNNIAKEKYEKMLKLRKKYKKEEDNESLGLKDMLSILCQAEGNGINVFNIAQLTVYQVYEHFERLNMKEHHTRLLRVWANGYLGENEKLPEWMIKGKM